MHVLLVNGSPRPHGCTYTALTQVEEGLARGGVESKYFNLGTAPVRGCVACLKCNGLNRCVFDDDPANALLDAMREADGIVLGSPVYYGAPNGALCALLDRVFFAGGDDMRGKAAAAVVSCRRAGATAALDRLHKYFTISNMMVVGSQYWGMVHGHTPSDVKQDLEGMQVMRTLGRNMAWLLTSTQKQPVPPSLNETRAVTNFIR